MMCTTFLLVTLVKKHDGKQLAVVDGYTFYPSRRTKCNVTWRLQWVTKKCGKQLAILDGFTYYLARQSNLTMTWRCTSAGQCRARFTVSRQNREIVRCNLDHVHKRPAFVIHNGVYLQFVQNGRGNLLALIAGYTYYRDKQYAKTQVWRCTKGSVCKGRFTITNDMHLLRAVFDHSHRPANYVVRDGNRLGKLLALISGYTYYRDKQCANTHVWRCTKSRVCKARFTLTNDMHLVRAVFDHSHQPVNYVIRDGVYIKI
ncbi:unnamed protein product, partial [Iphiclides podalirius]